MITYYTRVTDGEYELVLETDNEKLYELTQALIRLNIDIERNKGVNK